MVISLKMQKSSALQGYKTNGYCKREKCIWLHTYGWRGQTKSRTNPYPQKKPNPAWILQRPWYHPALENHLSWPWLQFPKNCSFTQMYTTCREISNNCKWERGGREEDKHLNQFSLHRPGTYIRITMMQNIYTPWKCWGPEHGSCPDFFFFFEIVVPIRLSYLP